MTMDTKDAPDAGAWATISDAPLAVKTILLGVFLNRLSGFLSIFLVLFLSQHGFTVGQAAIAVGVFGAGSVVSYLIGGILAERLGPRNLSVLSMVASAVLMGALLYVDSFGLLLAVVALAGVASQVWWPASATLLSDLTADSRQVMILALYRFAVNVGSAAAPLIGVLLYNLNDQQYTIAFCVQGLVAFAYGVLAFAVLPRRRPRVDTPADDVPAVMGAARSYLAVLRDRKFTLYLIATLFYTAVYMQYLSTLPLDVQAAGLSVFWYTVVVSLNGMIVIALELPLTKFVQRWPRRPIVCIAFALVGIGMATYGLPLAPAVLVVGTIIWTLGEMVGAPSVFAYPAIAGPVHLKSYYISSFQFVFGLATAVGMSVGVALFGQLGHRIWLVVALGAVLSVVFAFVALGDPLPSDRRPAESSRTGGGTREAVAAGTDGGRS
jgi:MFS family permease